MPEPEEKKMTKADYTRVIVGDDSKTPISHPEKMPGGSYSLEPVVTCAMGKKLGECPGTTCAHCYAKKGRYAMYPNIRKSQRARLNKIIEALDGGRAGRAKWIEAMTWLIDREHRLALKRYRRAWTSNYLSARKGDAGRADEEFDLMLNGIGGEPFYYYFRIHDSGDLGIPDDSMQHGTPQAKKRMLDYFLMWLEVARRLPYVKFWMPTKEYAFMRTVAKKYEAPSNLTIRISAPNLDEPALDDGYPTATVSKHRVGADQCPAPDQDGKCLDCRRCWNQAVKNVNYLYH